MKAFTRTKYGGPEILQLADVPRPVIGDNQLLVRVKANSLNPADWHLLRGEPRIARLAMGPFGPRDKIPGADFAGIVEEIGKAVVDFKMGDTVYGQSINGGAFAKFNAVPATICAKIPEGSDFLEMAGVPIAGLTAYQGLKIHGKVQSGESILINGASGGVGHFAVQMAKTYGLHVTGVCSSRNIDFVKGLGADQVIAYDQVNIHAHEGRYDIVMDNHGNLTHEDYARMGQRGIMNVYHTVGSTDSGSAMPRSTANAAAS